MNTSAAQIHYRHTAPEGFAVNFPVEQIFGEAHSRFTGARRISEDGVVVESMPDDGHSQYRWLSFKLPGTNISIKALGEFAGSSLEEGETHLKFKHIWPDARRELNRFLASNVSTVAA